MINVAGKKLVQSVHAVLLTLCALCLLFPVLILVVNSLESPNEVIMYYYSGKEREFYRFVPEVFSLKQYYEALLGNRTYINAMMNSILYSCPVTVVQLLLTIPAAFGLGTYCHRGRKAVVAVLLLLMLLPYQAIEIPNYMFMREIGLIGQRLAVILPNLFQPFSFCILLFLIMSIDREQMEAAELDGAGLFHVILRIVLPQILSGVMIVFLLQFIDMWNMTEQPLIFLEKTEDMPLSILLPELTDSNPGYAFGFSVIFLLPVALLYYSFHKEIAEELSGEAIQIKR